MAWSRHGDFNGLDYECSKDQLTHVFSTLLCFAAGETHCLEAELVWVSAVLSPDLYDGYYNYTTAGCQLSSWGMYGVS